MKRSKTANKRRWLSAAGWNLAAAGLLALAAGVLYFNVEPAERPGLLARRDPRPAVALRPVHAPRSGDRRTASAADARDTTSGVQQALFSTPQPRVVEGREALEFYLSLVEQGYQTLLGVPGYTATFMKQERVDGELGETQVMQLKLRHEPFSVYLKWLAGGGGRQVLYVDGEHDGKLLVRLGGWKGRLMPVLKLDPVGELANEDSRHPITKIGLLELARTLVENRRADLAQHGAFVRCRMEEDRQCNARPCYYFHLEYTTPQASDLYRKSELYVDREWSLPVFIKNYTWPDPSTELASAALDQETLIEHYFYSDLDLQAPLAEVDFDRNNSDYGFRR